MFSSCRSVTNALIVFLSIFILVKARGDRIKRVAGGTIVAPGEYKNVVAIFLAYSQIHDLKFVCSGTIISDRHVLTAAHCLEKDISNLVVATGVNDFTSNNREIHVIEKVIPHPDWRRGNGTGHGAQKYITEHDIGLILQMPIGENCITVGAGRTILTELTKPLLYKMKQSLVDLEECEKPRGVFNRGSYWLCASNGFAASCPGDSGGPLICRGYVVGVAAAASCVRNSPTLFTNVYNYNPWILEHLNSVYNKIEGNIEVSKWEKHDVHNTKQPAEKNSASWIENKLL